MLIINLLVFFVTLFVTGTIFFLCFNYAFQVFTKKMQYIISKEFTNFHLDVMLDIIDKLDDLNKSKTTAAAATRISTTTTMNENYEPIYATLQFGNEKYKLNNLDRVSYNNNNDVKKKFFLNIFNQNFNF